jgi:hypothetical protein
VADHELRRAAAGDAALIGLGLYRLDINFRESAVIGIVGAGGIGATLNTSISRYEYDSSAAILLIIIAIVHGRGVQLQLRQEVGAVDAGTRDRSDQGLAARAPAGSWRSGPATW